eukprot:6155672-Pyramimonas_sp.AAC.1
MAKACPGRVAEGSCLRGWRARQRCLRGSQAPRPRTDPRRPHRAPLKLQGRRGPSPSPSSGAGAAGAA